MTISHEVAEARTDKAEMDEEFFSNIERISEPVRHGHHDRIGRIAFEISKVESSVTRNMLQCVLTTILTEEVLRLDDAINTALGEVEAMVKRRVG